jgi:predicted SnoaL-like aldol condensation-catalyzing enzyme
MYTPYTDAAGMVLHINGKGKMGKLEIISFVVKFRAHRPSLSISICRSRHEADFVVKFRAHRPSLSISICRSRHEADFVVKFRAHRPSLSISICRSRHEADFVVLVVSFISSLVRIDVINTIVKSKIIK